MRPMGLIKIQCHPMPVPAVFVRVRPCSSVYVRVRPCRVRPCMSVPVRVKAFITTKDICFCKNRTIYAILPLQS